MKTVKFGGTSLASAEMMKHCADILKMDDARRFVVVSAPGKRSSDDIKVTDLLYRIYSEVLNDYDPEPTLLLIYERFREIVEGLEIDFDLEKEFDEIRSQLNHDVNVNWLASRGEYLNAKIFACYLGWPFIDAKDLIIFKQNHLLSHHLTYKTAGAILSDFSHAVIPGFYGADTHGVITTFSRGGSDVTGAVIARSVGADLYENWTDVSGVMTADPRIIDHPKQVKWISYRELRELSYMGASVLHEDAILPIRSTGIPIQIRNTMDPEAEGTMIVSKYPVDMHQHPVTGIAGKTGFSNLQIEMALMNTQVGFGARILEICAEYGISYEHTPTSIDIISVIAETSYFENCRREIIMKIDQEFHPDKLFIEDGMALVTVVGEGISTNVGVAAKVLQIISNAGINVRMIDAGCSELNIIIGINETDYEKTIRALYDGLHEYF